MKTIKFRILAIIGILVSGHCAFAQNVSSSELWQGYVRAVEADYLRNETQKIDNSIAELYKVLDVMYSPKLCNDAIAGIKELYKNEFITDKHKESLENLVVLIDGYKNESLEFCEIFEHEIKDNMFKQILSMETIAPSQVVMLAKILWNVYEPKAGALDFKKEYTYLNKTLAKLKDVFKKIMDKDPLISPESYFDALQGALMLESKLVEEHPEYLKLK